MSDKEFNKWKARGNFKLTHERILQVSNHISEGEDDCYTKKEAAEVATYHNLDASRIASEITALKTEGLIRYAEKLIRKTARQKSNA